MNDGLGLSADELAEVFTEWNKGELDSFLIDISATIFAKKDDDGQPMVDKILDAAGQKGTGKWTAISALDLGQPVTLIGESVFARCLSALKSERVAAAKVLKGPRKRKVSTDKKAFIEEVRLALYCSKMVSYAQGYMLLRAAEKDNGWNLNMGGVALMWRGGCIIRSVFLGDIKAAFDRDPKLQNLLLDKFFSTRNEQVPSRVAEGHYLWNQGRRPYAGVLDRASVLRRLPHRPPAREPVAGAARLLRSPHLRTCRQTPRRILPHQLDW